MDPAERLADALLEFTAPMTQILDHMARSPKGLALEPLRQLLVEVLAPLEGDLAAAADVVAAATGAIVDDILLVPHPPPRGRRRPECA